MKQKTIIASFLFACLTFLGFGLMSLVNANEDKQLIHSFEEVDFQLEEAVADISMLLDKEKEDYYGYSADKLSFKIAEELLLEGPYEYDFIDSETSVLCSIKKQARAVDTEILVNKYNNDSIYANIHFVISDQLEGAENLIERSKEVLRACGGEPTSSITYIGYYPGNRLEDSETILKGISEYMDIDIHWSLNSETFFNAYGYTKHIEDYIMLPKRQTGMNKRLGKDKEKVNVDIALTYNELLDRTQLYIGTNVINIDY